ncbi:hypothetical protein PITCH_A680021 [uncultured Desulfobacterium sp.]|uniref:Uncharacterized protein n=1 Tax=uncultured Desulfobacterium sp. TaxID=201089 RepID=A0A445N1P6_9BACT|nr:hypothetical protein PITCH_A680021 [uncultured Desulfobacterium sp.]
MTVRLYNYETVNNIVIVRIAKLMPDLKIYPENDWKIEITVGGLFFLPFR